MPSVEQMKAAIRERATAAGPVARRFDEAAELETILLEEDLAACRELIARLGELPPAPPTWRGRAGLALSRILRRALFWQTATQQELQQRQLAAVERLAVRIEALERRLDPRD